MGILNWQDWQEWAMMEAPGTYLEDQKKPLGDRYEELQALWDVPQDPTYHPEGNVWTHTCLTCNAAAEIATRNQLQQADRVLLLMAALCHDFGKPQTTKMEDGRWRSKKHAPAGGDIARHFLEQLHCPEEIVGQVESLVREHLFYASMDEITERVVKRLAKRLAPAKIPTLLLLIEADLSGRGMSHPPIPEKLATVLEVAYKLGLAD